MELLVKKAKRGDAEAFIELIEQNKLSMYKVARGFLHDEEDIADAMSETVLACYEKVGSLRQDAYFKTWMIRILINHCKDILRKQRRQIAVDDLSEFEGQVPDDGTREFRERIKFLVKEFDPWGLIGLQWLHQHLHVMICELRFMVYTTSTFKGRTDRQGMKQF